MLEAHPEWFSPNIVLRPIYEETILPNIAYLGGPAEVAYWMQLKPMFDRFSVQFSALRPSNFALVPDTAVQLTIEKFGLEDKALFQSLLYMKTAFVQQQAEMDVTLSEEKEKLI